MVGIILGLASTLTMLSAPEEAKRDSGWPGPFAAIKEPAGAAGAQETAVTPSGWAFGICTHMGESGIPALVTSRSGILGLVGMQGQSPSLSKCDRNCARLWFTFEDPQPCPDWYVRTEMVPSDEAAASMSPSS